MKNLFLLMLILTVCGCNRLNNHQEIEYMDYKRSDELVIEDNPTTAALLGILPGGGSFYTGQVGFGILGILMWPYSIIWDPIVGYNGSKYNNYHATVWKLKHAADKE